MKKSIIFIIGFLLSGVLATVSMGTLLHVESDLVEAEFTPDGLQIVKTSNLVPIETDTIEQLTETADIGINGIIQNTENYVYEDEEGIKTPYTKLTILIDYVYKGDPALLNTEIAILEFGGVISKEDLGMKEKFNDISEEELSEEVVVQSEGLENSRVGQEIVAFLMENTGMNTGFDYYQFTADYLSKFYFDEASGSYNRLVPTEEYLNSDQKKEEDILNSQVTEIIEEELTEADIVEEE